MVSRKTPSKQSSSDSDSNSSTIVPFGIEEFIMEPSTPMPMGPPDTASLTAMPEGWTPQVIPTDTDWRQDPRWQSLRGGVTPKQVSIPEDTLVPNPSPAKSAFSLDSEGDAELSPDTPTRPSIHRRRRRQGEYHHRPPVWIIQSLNSPSEHSTKIGNSECDLLSSSGAESTSGDPFGVDFGQSTYHNQLAAMASNINIEPVVVGMMQQTDIGDENYKRITHQTPLPATQSDSASLTRNLTIPNTLADGNSRKFTLRPIHLADTDAITPAPAHRPSQEKLSSEEKIRIGHIITKLPKHLTDQVNLIIRKKMPEAKSSYETVMDVFSLPEDVLIALQDWLRKRSESVTASSSEDSDQKVQSSKSDLNGTSSPVPDENGNRCISRCEDIRVRTGAYEIEACAFYQRDQDCNNESSGEPTNLTRKAVQLVFGRQDERDAVKRKLTRCANGATHRMSPPISQGRIAGSSEKGKPELPGVPNAALGDLPSPRDSQIGPIRQSERPAVDNMVLRDPGNLLSRDPAARHRHAEGPYWPIVNPRSMSIDEPRASEAVETESWGRVIGRRMANAGRELSSGLFKKPPSLSRGVRRMASWVRPNSSSIPTETMARQSGPEPNDLSAIPEWCRRPRSRMRRGSASGRMPVMSGGGASLPTIVSPDHFVRLDNHEDGGDTGFALGEHGEHCLGLPPQLELNTPEVLGLPQ